MNNPKNNLVAIGLLSLIILGSLVYVGSSLFNQGDNLSSVIKSMPPTTTSSNVVSSQRNTVDQATLSSLNSLVGQYINTSDTFQKTATLNSILAKGAQLRTTEQAQAHSGGIASQCVPGEQQRADLAHTNFNGVDTDDLLVVINNWGPVQAGNIADIVPLGGNGIVNVDDLLFVISQWGPMIPCNTFILNKAGTGQGTVTEPQGLNCGLSCQTQTAYFTEGTVLNLSQLAGPTSVFSSWAGACTGSGSCSVTMTGNKTVTANFSSVAPTNFTLTVTKSGTGSGTVTSNPTGINCGSDCTETYPQNTSVTLTAVADAGSLFSNWTGTCAGSTSICNVNMSASDRTTNAVFNVSSSGGTTAHEASFIAPDGAPNNYLGQSVATDGDIAVIGAYGHAHLPGNISSGAAYVLRRSGSTWTQEAELRPSDGAAGDQFGDGVAISGNVIVVGAPYRNEASGADSGKVYVFRYNGSDWVQEAKLVANDASSNSLLGYSVAISGNNIIAGAFGAQTNGAYSGAAYVFNYNGSTWNQTSKLVASDAMASDFFGLTTSISGNIAVVGAYLSDPVGIGTNSGAAYVFETTNGTTWTQTQKITASDGEADDKFGSSVSISGNRLIIGASYDDDPTAGSNVGSAYIFEKNGASWNSKQKLIASDGLAFDWFGASVGINGNVAIVGANGADVPPPWINAAGAAYVFKYNGANWVQNAKVTRQEGSSNGEFFGYSVGISSQRAIVGGPQIRGFNPPQGGGLNAGEAYIYTIPN